METVVTTRIEQLQKYAIYNKSATQSYGYLRRFR